MWYFAWMLGLPLAAILAVVNAIWIELGEDRDFMEPPRGKTPPDA